MNDVIKAISATAKLDIISHQKLTGGDINEAYCLNGNDQHYFLKINSASLYPNMFEQEAKGLNALRDDSLLSIPTVIQSGIESTQQYLLLEWIEEGHVKSGFWKTFGEGLAAQHKRSQLYFGWNGDNYIGSLKQINTAQKTWSEFYAVCRILPFIKRLFDDNLLDQKDVTNAASLCKKTDELFPREKPSLLHGDLWSGNFLVAKNGSPVLIDPAVYYGHREMDLGMTRLFGGFDYTFYEAYVNAYPLEKNWQQRLPLTQLYPLLVHAILFGGNYINQAKNIFKNFA